MRPSFRVLSRLAPAAALAAALPGRAVAQGPASPRPAAFSPSVSAMAGIAPTADSTAAGRAGAAVAAPARLLPVRPPAHAPLVSPDRPGFSYAPGTLPAGAVQLETGATDAHAGTQSYRTVGEALLRVGVVAGTELRVSGQSFAVRTDAAAPLGTRTATGTEDARVGVKQRLVAGHGSTGLGATSLALLAGTTVPSGSPGFGARAWQPEATLLVNTPLTARFSLVENVSDSYAAASATPDGRRRHRVGGTVAGWYTVSSKLSAFGEYAGSRLAGTAAPAAHYVDAGVALAPVGHVQLDLRAGAGMNGVPGDRFVGAGLVRRW